MSNPVQLFIAIILVLNLAACAAIKGVSNTNLYADIPRSGTFAVRLVSGDPVIGNKIEKMLRFKLERLGYRYDEKSPDFLASFTYDTVAAGTVSSAQTVISQAPQTAYVYGNTVRFSPSYATATTISRSTQLYTKTIAVRISRAETGQKLWDGVVSETGWCNQLFVTAPQILSLMFDGFPKEQTNLQRTVTNADDSAKEIRTVFPADTDWGCQRT